jgi:hypothetical protein
MAILGAHAQPQTITCSILKIGHLEARLVAENPVSRALLSPQIMVPESGQRRILTHPENQPYPLSRPQQPEAGAKTGAGPPTLQQALRLAFQFAVQTTAETGPQVKPRVALQQTIQVPSAEAIPVPLQFSIQVPVEFGWPIATRDPVDFAVRFAPQVASRITVRTTPGTVPGTVPRANREASFPATHKWTALLKCCETSSYGEGPDWAEDPIANPAFWCV